MKIGGIMKKNIIVYIISIIVIVLIGFFLISFITDSNEFEYDEAKKTTQNYLNKNENKLIELVNNLYESKTSKKNPLKTVNYAAYENNDDFDFKNKKEYIKIDLDSQGMLGGQYYGLIYSKESNDDFIVYDEKKETNKGNNIFIRQKIEDNWYFYYEDYDGKVDINKIKR